MRTVTKKIENNPFLEKSSVHDERINNHTLSVGPSFSGKTYLMLTILSRIPNGDFYIITKTPPKQYSNSEIEFEEIGQEKTSKRMQKRYPSF